MKTLIAGSRTITDMSVLAQVISWCWWDITAVISGTANGVDRLGEQYAKSNNIPVHTYPADWDTYGKSAGYIRNKQMADVAEAAIIIWDGKSKGTSHMLDLLNEKKVSPMIIRTIGS